MKKLIKSRNINSLTYELINFHKDLGDYIHQVKTRNYDLNKLFDYVIELNKVYEKYVEVE